MAQLTNQVQLHRILQHLHYIFQLEEVILQHHIAVRFIKLILQQRLLLKFILRIQYLHNLLVVSAHTL